MAVIELRTVCVLHVRLSGPRDEMEVRVNGAAVTPRPLGHDAGQRRGTHPYLIVTTLDYPPSAPLELTTNRRLTRCLLTSTVTLVLVPDPPPEIP
ncbi:hypothetical protein [Deinococcus radiotolerans]|uniref:Uncharacterized protein n=1 Tax=Deinococcus radiotolerans TaxID=1309407 RepID=A0ABQ2FQY0_9DEIO|nr:hypothetical protein [Deinococcus radiotolerans]GGL18220.1 hypothetical protein GCM10010844_41360 [Deinococcus radiotolerans]